MVLKAKLLKSIYASKLQIWKKKKISFFLYAPLTVVWTMLINATFLGKKLKWGAKVFWKAWQGEDTQDYEDKDLKHFILKGWSGIQSRCAYETQVQMQVHTQLGSSNK